MKITAILCALLALASGGLLWQTHQRGKDAARNEALSRELMPAKCLHSCGQPSSKETPREKSDVKTCAMPSKTIRVPILLCLLLSVTACNTAPPQPQMNIVYEPVPESLTAATPAPELTAPVTWGAIAIWSDRLRDALDTCNADKAAIADLDLRRLKRLTDHARATQ